MKVLITQPVEHDGKPLAVGKVADLDKEVALALIASGAAEDSQAKADADKAAKARAEKLAALDKAVEEAQAKVIAETDEAKKAPLITAFEEAVAARQAADAE